jgi:hypothetical protein
MEARVGFEPTNGGFADLSLRPLGYRAECLSIAKQGSTCQWGLTWGSAPVFIRNDTVV